MCNLRVDWDLPAKFSCLSLAFVAISLVPAALWADAITPIITTTKVPASINTPVFRPDPSGNIWNKSWSPFLAPVTYNDKGTFSYPPGVSRQALILNNAAAVISPNNISTRQSKTDLTQYSYNNRSHGVGASPGLVEALAKNVNLLSYN